MRKLILAAVFLGTAATCWAQNYQEVKKFEFEPFVGVTYGFKNPGTRVAGPAMGLEARWNLRSIPLDIGAQMYLGSACGTYKEQIYIDRIDEFDLSCRTFSIGAFSDYNFNRGGTVSPFVGAGLSCNLYDMITGSYNDYEGDNTSGIGITPRVGVELFQHLRITLSARIGRSLYSHAALTIGYAFGGGAKNK